jgi:hypothetical protein
MKEHRHALYYSRCQILCVLGMSDDRVQDQFKAATYTSTLYPARAAWSVGGIVTHLGAAPGRQDRTLRACKGKEDVLQRIDGWRWKAQRRNGHALGIPTSYTFQNTHGKLVTTFG